MHSLTNQITTPLIAKISDIQGFLDLLKNSYKLNPQFVEISETMANAIRKEAIQKQRFYYHARGDSTEFKAGDRILLTNPGCASAPKYWVIKV
jgi:hypothetical protein